MTQITSAMALSSRLIYMLAITFLAIVFFQAPHVYTQEGLESCSNFTTSDDCCKTVNLNCTFCAENVTASGVCVATNDTGMTCLEPQIDQCQTPVDVCANVTVKESCCNSSCLFCLNAAGETACASQCETNSTDQCAVEPTVAPDTTTSTGAPPAACGELNETTCCAIAEHCSLCNKTDGSGSECRDYNTCDTASEVDACAAAPPTTQPSQMNSTATPSGGGSSGQRFDAASFIGGIVLCGGLVAIVYFGCKFYKARKDQNYHTL